MTPYYHQSNISIPPSPREGNTFPPLKSHPQKVKGEGLEEEGRGPFDEDDIELQLSSPSRSNLEMGLKVLKYCSIIFLGLAIIGTSIHISSVLYQTTPTQHCKGLPPGVPCISENRALVDVKYKIDTIRHTSIQVPTYPQCDEAGCLIHQIPGSGAEPIRTATILSTSTFTHGPRFTIVNTPTPTSPPICIPSHCFPHTQGSDLEAEVEDVNESPPICVPHHCYPHHHHSHEEVQVEVTGLDEGDQSPPICVPPHCYPHQPGETPPICVPPHCYPHPPPGHHDHHHHHDHEKEGETTKEQIPPPCFPPHCYPPPLNVPHQSPPICVPPHCNPHAQDEFEQEEQQDNSPTCVEPDCTPNVIPGKPLKECVAPYCYVSNPGYNDCNDSDEHEHEHDHEREHYDEVSDTDHPKYNTPKACHPPHCYPPTPPSHLHLPDDEQVGESPPICVPPHCYPSNLPGHEQDPLPNDEDQSQSPPICVPPHCFPHSVFKGDDVKDQVVSTQTDQERQIEYLIAHPEIVTLQDHAPGSNQEVKNEGDDDDKPICMPPICVPPAQSAPIFIPCHEEEEED